MDVQEIESTRKMCREGGGGGGGIEMTVAATNVVAIVMGA